MPKTIEGTDEATASALASPYCAPWKPRNARKMVGSERAPAAQDEQKKNSVETKMKANTAAMRGCPANKKLPHRGREPPQLHSLADSPGAGKLRVRQTAEANEHL